MPEYLLVREEHVLAVVIDALPFQRALRDGAGEAKRVKTGLCLGL